MDCSNNYVKMCEAAREIQRPVWVGEFYYRKGLESGRESVGQAFPKIYDEARTYDNVKIVWLPRLDQLQEMLLPAYPNYICLLHHFGRWLLEAVDEDDEDADGETPEVVWLAFYMDIKFDKFFDGARWVFEKKEEE